MRKNKRQNCESYIILRGSILRYIPDATIKVQILKAISACSIVIHSGSHLLHYTAVESEE